MKPVDSKPDFVAVEHKILNFWDENQCFRKLVKKNAGKKRFRFLDGPITANNPMGAHHAWGRTLKDIFIRYKSLTGHTCHYQNGFDCQGLWVEVEVEKDLGFKGKPDIVKFGLDKFSQACRARVDKFSKIQSRQSMRLGQWMDWDNSYYTHDDSNIAGIWHFLKKCHENGWLYQGGQPMPWCPRCGTSLSEHEMAGSYEDMSHKAVFIKLKLVERDARILVWTTTPWTLAANVALAVNPALEYSEVILDGEDTPLILCSDTLHVLNKRQYQVIDTYTGDKLLGLHYEAVIPELEAQNEPEHNIIPWTLVDPAEGTGVVHIAPGCGKEDFDLGKEVGGLTILAPIDETGMYLPGYGCLEGKYAQNVADEIVDYLEKSGKLFHAYMHEHSYPVCWRCKEPLLFRFVEEWYIRCDEIRPRMLAAVDTVQWQPDYMGKRMADWLNNMGDWCISRKRFWGLPLPFYKCPSCGELTVVGSLEELKELSGDNLGGVPELHRPWIDEITINCPRCHTRIRRIEEVGDCWLDAGIVPFATRGYFTDREEWEKWYPAEWITEMREQIRLWFYSMLFMSVTLLDRAPYERVLTYERMIAEDGAKFSKTGFMIKFEDAAEEMGVDTMRYYFASHNPERDIRFGYKLGDEARRRLLSFWNIYAFFVTYARLDNPQLDKIQKLPDEGLSYSDRWLLARLYSFCRNATQAMEGYDTPSTIREFDSFVDDVSNWYVRSNRRRFWKSDMTQDKLVGYWVLFQAIKNTAIIMAPIIPFMTDEIWQNAVRSLDKDAAESVHLSDWPEPDESWRDDELLARTEDTRKIINTALRMRKESQLKVRQPLATLFLHGPDHLIHSAGLMAPIIINELNVKEIKYLDSVDDIQDVYIELDLKKAGPTLKQNLRKVVAIVNGLAPEQASEAAGSIEAQQQVRLPGYDQDLGFDLFVIKSRPRQNMVTATEENLTVALDTNLTPELEREGWVRDILRHTQVLRKDAGLNVEDRIILALVTESDDLNSAIKEYIELIKDETLAEELAATINHPSGEQEIELGPGKVKILLKKV